MAVRKRFEISNKIGSPITAPNDRDIDFIAHD